MTVKIVNITIISKMSNRHFWINFNAIWTKSIEHFSILLYSFIYPLKQVETLINTVKCKLWSYKLTRLKLLYSCFNKTFPMNVTETFEYSENLNVLKNGLLLIFLVIFLIIVICFLTIFPFYVYVNKKNQNSDKTVKK